MQTLQIRTTLSLPLSLHKKLKEEALNKNKSLNKLVLEKLETKPRNTDFKVKPFAIGVRGSLRRLSIYEEILNRQLQNNK